MRFLSNYFDLLFMIYFHIFVYAQSTTCTEWAKINDTIHQHSFFAHNCKSPLSSTAESYYDTLSSLTLVIIIIIMFVYLKLTR